MELDKFESNAEIQDLFFNFNGLEKMISKKRKKERKERIKITKKKKKKKMNHT